MAQIASAEVRGGKTNLEKLLKPTKFHPKGRVKINPDTGEVDAPKNNIIGKRDKVIRDPNTGLELARFEVTVNGGHVTNGTVWRIGLGGPKKYHERVMQDEERKRLKGGNDRLAVELTMEEAREYADYREFLKETSQTIAENADFYAWKAKGKKKAE